MCVVVGARRPAPAPAAAYLPTRMPAPRRYRSADLCWCFFLYDTLAL